MIPDLWAELRREQSQLMEDLELCKRSGAQLAENEREYRKALRTAILTERERGTPVSIVGDVARGIPSIADLKCARDCSEAVYKASQEAINVRKLNIKVIDAQMSREWHSGNGGL